MTRSLSVAALTHLVATAACSESEPDKTPYPFIVEDGGRALILRGLNVMSSAKSDPLRMPNAGAEDFRRMAEDWGFNHVRFLIF